MHLATPLNGNEMIPDLVRTWPGTRLVFDRYGLHCCGGPYGPAETIRYFSRAHAVELERLIGELEAAMEAPVAPGPETELRDPAGTIYRLFFTAGIVATLTAGAAWGAYLLLKIGFAGAFEANSPFEVNAHGHAQVSGWVGLFVMGFAYQAFPRFKHTSLRRPRLALATLPIYVAGLVPRTLGEALQPSPAFLYVGLAGSLLEAAALGIFAWIVFETVLSSTARRAATDRYILAATVWFVLQGLYDACFFALTAASGSTEILVWRIAAFQPALRDMQVHGFAMLMIFGVSLRYLPGMIGLERVSEKIADALLITFNFAVLGEMAGHLGKRLATSPIFPWLLEASFVVLAASAAVLAWKLGILHRRAEPDRSVKFLRAAYAWLLISLAMLVLQPAYLAASARGFSHAYSGAARHAVTVGFISLMIVGVASKVVPTLNGVPAAALPRLWLPFALINTGCALRVVFQALTDWTPSAFPVAGVSGLLEVTGLLLWGAHILRVMGGRYRFALEAPAGGPPEQASPHHVVGWLTSVAPETIPVFERRGFSLITGRLLRETVARTVTIRQACALRGVDESSLIVALDEVLAARAAAKETAQAGAAAHRAAGVPAEFVGRMTRR